MCPAGYPRLVATDLALAQRPNGLYDFVVTATGGLETTDDVAPALLRLAIQGEWIGDGGERKGESLVDVRVDTGDVTSKAQLILETRFAALVARGDLERFEVTDVQSDGAGLLSVAVTYWQPGREPRSLQVPVRA